MNKALKIVLIVLVAIIVFVMVALLLVKAGEKLFFHSFYKDATKEFAIPGLMEGYVPQGFDYMEKEDVFLACGYMANSKASRVYVIERDGSYKYTELKKSDGSDYTGHTGGIAYYQNHLYITGGKGIDVFTLSDVLEGKESTKLLGTVETHGVDPAYCFIYDGQFYAGSFHHTGHYDTPEKHHITTPTNDVNKSILLSFYLNPLTKYGIESTPCAVYSTPSFVQGATVTDEGQLVLSTSWGLSVSHLYFYDLEKIHSKIDSSFASDVFGFNAPLYYVDSASLENTVDAPPMAEEIICLDNKIWVMNESSCSKYIFGRFMSGNDLFSYSYKKEK